MFVCMYSMYVCMYVCSLCMYVQYVCMYIMYSMDECISIPAFHCSMHYSSVFSVFDCMNYFLVYVCMYVHMYVSGLL